MPTARKVNEKIDPQAPGEAIIYRMNTAEWGGVSQILSVEVFEDSNLDVDIAATHMPAGTHQIAGDWIVLKPFKNVVKGERYKVVVLFRTPAGNEISGYFFVPTEAK